MEWAHGQTKLTRMSKNYFENNTTTHGRCEAGAAGGGTASSPARPKLARTREGGRAGGDRPQQKHTLHALSPAGSSCMSALTHKQLLHSSYAFRGNLSFRLRKIRKQFVFSTKQSC